MRRKVLVDYLVYLVVRILICIAQALPIETGQRVSELLAWIFCEALRLRRDVVEDNLRHAFPQMSALARRRIARQMWRHLFLLALEVAHAPRKIHETNWRRFVQLRNKRALVQALLDRRPLMIVTAHFGNFEVAGYTLGILGFPTYTVARKLDNPHLDEFLNRFRGQTGQYIIAKNGEFDQIVNVMEGGGALTLLADQHAGRKGCWVEFFGRPASAHKAIALLALNHDARLAVASARRLDRPLQIELCVHTILDPREIDAGLATIEGLTQWYSSRMEEFIRQAPQQYWWLHRRWREPQTKRRKQKKAA